MTEKIEQVAENFSRHNFESTYSFLSENIKWHLIGDKTLIGKEDIIDACKQSAQYLKGVVTKFIKFNIIVSDNCIVIDSLADYIDNEQQSARVSSCDIYKFLDNTLNEITSYTIEIKDK